MKLTSRMRFSIDPIGPTYPKLPRSLLGVGASSIDTSSSTGAVASAAFFFGAIVRALGYVYDIWLLEEFLSKAVKF